MSVVDVAEGYRQWAAHHDRETVGSFLEGCGSATTLTPRPTPGGAYHAESPLSRLDPVTRLPILILFAHGRCNCRCVMCDVWRGAGARADAGVAVTARRTVQRENRRHLRDTVRAARSLGLDRVSFLSVDVTSDAFNRPGGWDAERVRPATGWRRRPSARRASTRATTSCSPGS